MVYTLVHGNDGNNIIYTIRVPFNANARMVLPNGKEYKVAAGVHNFNDNGIL